jgi:hypothetical protein
VCAVLATAGVAIGFSAAAGAAVTTPLMSTSTSGSGTSLNVTFNEAPVLASPYSVTLADGSHVATFSSATGSLSASVSGSSIHFTLSGSGGLSLSSLVEVVGSTGINDGSGNPWDLVASGQVDKALLVATGDKVSLTFNEPVNVAPAYSFTLTEGSGSAVIDNGNSSVSSGSGTATVTFTMTASPSGTVAADGPTASNVSGVTAVPSVPAPPTVIPVAQSVSVSFALPTLCSNVGVTRVFNGSNCDLGFNKPGPLAPDVYDVIPVPTQDLPGPPNDAAPEVITSCQAGSTDVAYDVNTGAELGANACGNNPPGEASIGNTNSNTLDYIPTPNLASFHEVGVVETIPNSTFVSATSVPPQLSGITVSGNQATFSYYDNVACQASTGSSDAPTIASYTYVTPYTKTALVPGDLVYPTAISCPPGGGANSVTVTYANPIPFSSGVRFKFTGYGAGHYIIGAPGSAFAYEREASESAYAGPSAAITSFTPQSTTLPSSAGGSVAVSFATTSAQTCSISAISLPPGAAALTLPSVASCNGAGTIAVPANTSASNVVYTVTLTALGVPSTPVATAEITITVPAAPPPPVDATPPTISGSATQGAKLTDVHGSWSNSPTGYSYQWQRCDGTGSNCLPISGATGQTYKVIAADVRHRLRVQEAASNASGAGSPATSAPTATVRASLAGGKKPSSGPHTRLLLKRISSRSHSAQFRFKATGKSTGFRCALVRKPTRKGAKKPSPKYSACRSPKAFAHLKAGKFVFYVRAVGRGGLRGPSLAYSFKIA